MSQPVTSILGVFFDGWEGIAHLLLTLGLLLAAINAVRFLRGRTAIANRAVQAPAASWAAWLLRGGLPALVWPPLLVGLGFGVASGTNRLWQLAVAALVWGLGVLLLRRMRDATEPGTPIPGAALAALLTFLTLLLFGLLFIARVTVGRTSEIYDTGADLVGDSVVGTAKALLLAPALLVLLVLAERIGPLRRAAAGLAGWVQARVGRWPLPAGTLLIAVLFGLPMLGSGIAIGGLQTQEFGKIAYFFVLALILVRYGEGFRRRDGFSARRELCAAVRSPDRVVQVVAWGRLQAHILWPLALFSVAAGLSGLRSDFGPLAALLIATIVALAYTVRIHAHRAFTASAVPGPAGERAARRNARRYARTLITPAVLLCASFAFVVSCGYGQDRIAIWLDPWEYPWSPECSSTVVAVPAIDIPATAEPCLHSYAATRASEMSQVAQAVSVLTDGGLWGRGLDDTTSGRVPVGDADFVLALIWSKLGALTVLQLAVLTALLCYALFRLPVTRRYGADCRVPPRATTEVLYAAGIGAVLLAQFTVQLAMTVNLLPHSGLTTPFLSLGAQSTLALGLGVCTVLALVLRTPSGPAGPASSTTRSRLRFTATGAVLTLIVLMMASAIVYPYRTLPESRAACQPSDLQSSTGRVRSETCSTDETAFITLDSTIRIDGVPEFHSVANGWAPTDRAGMTVADMGGLLLPGVLAPAIRVQRPMGVRSRLLPPAPRDGTSTLDLTIAGPIQRAVARALEADGPDGAAPLPAGLAIIEASSGHVLAAAGAPVRNAAAVAAPEPSWQEAGAAQDAAEEANAANPWQRNGGFVRRSDCSVTEPVDTGCFRWQVRPKTVAAGLRTTEELRRFVAGDPTVAPPSDALERAFGRQFGVGSTFKVVIAAAYLRVPGNAATDPIPAPLTSAVNGKVIDNYGQGPCDRVVDGEITLADALAVSCNTAFVELARVLGWEAVRDTAVDFGFTVDNPDGAGGAWLTGPAAGVASTVPSSTTELGNVALGGGTVAATPLQMATVLAAIANDGLAVQPSLIAAVRTDTGDGPWIAAPTRRQVLAPEAAAQLRDALAGTTTYGTATELRAPDGRQIWAKTGTHEVVAPDEPNRPGEFTRQLCWLTGFVETPDGPVAFAVEVATRDEKDGSRRVRWLAQQAIEAIVGERG